MDRNPWEEFEQDLKKVSEGADVAQTPMLAQELDRLLKMYYKAKADQMGITLGLMDIQAEVHCLYKERGRQVPPEILEFFKP